MPTSKNFYRKADARKKVLKQTIRPTYAKRVPMEVVDEDDEQVQEAPFFPVTSITGSRSRVSPRIQEVTKPLDARNTSKADDISTTDNEISRISEMITQASTRLKELEEQKRMEEEARLQAPPDEEIDDFNGPDEDEEREMLREQIEHYRAQNQRLKSELKQLKAEFDKERETLKKDINRIRKDVDRPQPVGDNKFFSFTDELKEAIKAIETLKDPDFKPIATEVVIKADEVPPVTQPSQLTQVSTQPAHVIGTFDQSQISVNPQAATNPGQPTSEPIAQAAPKPEPTPEQKQKKVKEKKLLATGVTVLVVLFGGGVLSYMLTSTPKVDSRLVEEYLENNSTQVLGAQSPTAHVPDGIVADKNSDAAYDATEWAKYEDVVMGIRLNYPANVTERLHTSNSITFMRKDSYIFKITKHKTDLDLASYWEQNKDKGIAYTAEPAKLSNREALYLQLQEIVQYPGDRYLIEYNDAIYDVWFATDPQVFGADDIQRAKDMVDSVQFI